MTQMLRVLERELLRETGKRLARFGFSSRSNGQTYYRDTDQGCAGVHLSFIEHEDDVDVTVDVAIRFDAVEELVHHSNRLLSKKEKAETFTLGAELGNQEGGEPFRLTMASRSDIQCAADGIVTKPGTISLPYIEQYSRPEAAYSLLSKDVRDVWLRSPIHWNGPSEPAHYSPSCASTGELGAQKLLFLESVNDLEAIAFSRFLAELPSERDSANPGPVLLTRPGRSGRRT